MYNNYKLENSVKSTLNIDILPIRKSNLKRQHEPSIAKHIRHARKSIETAFSQITSLFPRKIHAVTAKGFELKIFCFILAYSFNLL